ncbi:LysR family transcriptional regulator [Rhodobacteraceae bacterium WD3A24]|nr:LysR family transcriptional regulator [Rhodobacteraceae bacterium WD3A24]
MSIEGWDEIRTAYHVAREGTVSGAAAALGVHHATVIRHVDALEGRLGVKLFQRHARGYTPTEAGEDLLKIARATDDQFAQLASRIRGRGTAVEGELVVTSIPGLSRVLAGCMTRFQESHPELILRFVTDARLLRLEYGEAHVAIRAGQTPQEPDNVVQQLGQQRHALYAAPGYGRADDLPLDLDDPAQIARHRFVGADTADTRVPFLRWLQEVAPAEAISFRSNDLAAQEWAVVAGAGIGFLPVWEQVRASGATERNLIEVAPEREEWSAPLWIVTHVDLHRTTKVQAFLQHLKAEAAEWPLG